jgi:hypothetical protein
MRLVFKAVLGVVLIAAVGLVGYAIFFDLPPPVREVSLPVDAR